jgi:3-methyladenine DNA glycosylase AlkD
MQIQELRERLKTLAEPRFQAFASSLIPGEQHLLGVRLPILRKLAKEAARSNREEIFNEPTPPQSMEECLLRGMLPGYANKSVELEHRLQELVRFVPLITNWSICDSCCATYKFARENREHVWDFLQPYLYSEKEFEARFGLVMLLNHFIQQEEWVARIMGVLPSLPCKGYYAEMAAAWLLCEIHLRYPTLAATLLAETTPLSPAIRNRALRKIRESARKG